MHRAVPVGSRQPFMIQKRRQLSSGFNSVEQDNIQLAGVLISLILGIALASVWFWKRRNAYDPPTPPGSLGLPILGETLHYLQCMRANKPWEFFESRERKYGQVFKTSIFGCPTVIVKPPHGNKFLFSNHNKLVGSAWPSPMKTLIGENSLFFMDGDKAKNFRHILLAFLGPEAMQRYVGNASLVIREHLENYWLGETEVKAYPLVKQALFSVVFNLFLSLSNEEEQQELLNPFLRVLQGLLELPIDFPGTKFYEGKKGRKRIFEKFDKCIQQRRVELEQGKATPQQDLLSVLITTEGEDGKLMNDEEIKENILLLVLAGHDTSASSLAVSIKCIAENPWCYDELRKEHLEIAASKAPGEALNRHDLRRMKYTWRVIQESMRLIPAAQGSLRRALVDFEMEGFTIPKGWQLHWSVYRSNKREEFFEEPERFNPRRFEGSGPAPYTHVPFGGGPRICPGIELAKMQDCLFLHHLITRFKWSLVDPDEPVLMAPLAAPTKGLPIKLTHNPIATTL